MNVVLLIGRLTKEVDLRYSPGGTAVAKFTLAVPRRFKAEGKPDTDFINVVAFGKTAENCATYLKKGNQCAVQGSWQADSHENNEGKRVYTSDCLADNVRFLESNRSESNQSSGQASTPVSPHNDPFKDDG